MSVYRFTESVHVKFTKPQRRLVAKAARIETERRGLEVADASLVRELVLPLIDKIISSESDAPAQQVSVQNA